MITGDSALTAQAIADETGLRPHDGLVLTGAELPDDEQVLGALVDRDGVVIARVTPEDKLRIARALRARGHVIAMTGDGVNDGPALREADIGIAMGASGSDVAREAADLVLLDDNFATIVAAVEQGRATFANARRFLTYHLTDNVAELTPFVIWALSGGQFPLALGVLQILALDIGTDTLSAVALGSEPAGAARDDPATELRPTPEPDRRHAGVRGARSDRSTVRDDRVRRRADHRRLESRRQLPDRPGPVRSIGRRLPQCRRRPVGERIRLPQHSPSGVEFGWFSNRFLLIAVPSASPSRSRCSSSRPPPNSSSSNGRRPARGSSSSRRHPPSCSSTPCGSGGSARPPAPQRVVSDSLRNAVATG